MKFNEENMVKKIPNLLILFISFNFLSCSSFKYYDVDGYYNNISEYFKINVNGLHINYEEYRGSLLILTIENKNETKIGKTIIIEELKISTKNIARDLKWNIQEISFLNARSSYYHITHQEMNNFFDTNSIDVPVQTDEKYFKYCIIEVSNPRIDYLQYPSLTLSFKINVELEDGTIEQIVFKKQGKRRHDLLPIFPFLLFNSV
jgi:hypothetical protein